MQLNQIDLLGFRQLVNRSFDFKPGLNLIYGPNEAGKSTLMEAIAILLYGFFDEGRISSKERDDLNQHKPWTYMGAFGGTLNYTLDSGETFQIQRTFAPEILTTLTRLSDQRNLTDKFRNEGDGRVFFAEEQLGINKSVFENVCVVRQSELALLEQSATPIAETIMRLSSTMAADGFTVNEALALLETTFKQKVGTTRAYSKPFAITTKRVEQLKQAIDDAKAVRKGAWEALTSVNTQKEDIFQLEKQYSDCQTLLLKSRLTDTLETLDHISRLQQEVNDAKQVADELQQWDGFRHDIYEQLVSLDARRIAFEAELKSGGQDPSERIDTFTQKQEELTAQIEGFKSIPIDLIHTITAKKKEIEKAAQTLDTAQKHLEKLQAEADKTQAIVEMTCHEFPYVEIGHSALAKLQHQYETIQSDLDKSHANLETHTAEWKQANMDEETFLALKDTSLDTPQKKGCKPLQRKANSASSVPSELVIYNDLLPIYTQWKNTQAATKEAEQSKADIEATVRKELFLEDVPVEAKTFEQASTKIDEYLKSITANEVAVRNLEEANTAFEEAVEHLDSLKEQLNEMLPEGIHPDQDIEDEHQQIQKLRERLLDVESEIEKLGDEDVKWQRKDEEYQQVLTDLQNLYKEARINEVLNLEEKLLSYKSERENYLAWQNASREAHSAEQRLQEFPFQSDKLSKQVTDLEKQLQTLVNQNPDAASLEPVEAADYYQTELERLQEQIQEVKQHKIVLTNEASLASESMVDLASLLEEYGEAVAELNRLKWFGEALQTAQNELAKASTTFQQQFTPRLQAFLNSSLSHATSARYAESRVDPETLVVKLLVPETQRWIHVDQLSTGTRDLVYLLLRFSIARLMSRSGEQLPMLLDDPFVHCDRGRKTNILTYLINQASDMQFILFTQDDWTLTWLNTNYPDCNVVVMSHDKNTSIDYTLVETLTDQSEAVRERLLGVEESDGELLINSSAKEMSFPSAISNDPGGDTSSAVSRLPDETFQAISDMLLSDETAIKILMLLEKFNWEMPESDVQNVLQGQFLSVILDTLNNRSLDSLGDQLLYMDNDHLIVTEEYRPSLSSFLKQLSDGEPGSLNTDTGNS